MLMPPASIESRTISRRDKVIISSLIDFLLTPAIAHPPRTGIFVTEKRRAKPCQIAPDQSSYYKHTN
jgi:hypothetical protein